MNPLADCGLPRFFPVSGDAAERFSAPDARGGEAIRLYCRSLASMQKEAVVCTSAGGVWRLASDEGAYLNGLDEAPCPLAFMTAGMVASFMDAVRAGLSHGGAAHRGLRLVQDNFYTMQGSMPRRTMIAGAKPVELEVEIETDCNADELRPLVVEAVDAAPVSGLLRHALRNTFTLTVNGRELLPESSPHLRRPPLQDPRRQLEDFGPVAALSEPLVTRDGMTPLTDEVTSHAGSSYAPEQHRTRHVRGICTVRKDGVKEIEQHLYNPHGSIVRFLSAEADASGGRRAPDANTYISAGIGFCFMTQFGRFANIMRKRLDSCQIVQDTRFTPRHADPVETHVYLDTSEDDTFAREVLDIGERTCFLHALCRAVVPVHVRVTTARTFVTEHVARRQPD